MDIFLTLVNIGSENNGFCANTANIWQLVGYVLLAFKIVIPVILIVMGILDLGKAVVASKSDEVKKATTSLAMRAVAAIAIFLIPTIIGLVMGFVSDFSKVEKDYSICKSCITSPRGTECKGKADNAWK